MFSSTTIRKTITIICFVHQALQELLLLEPLLQLMPVWERRKVIAA
jgi:hypothetical protein